MLGKLRVSVTYTKGKVFQVELVKPHAGGVAF